MEVPSGCHSPSTSPTSCLQVLNKQSQEQLLGLIWESLPLAKGDPSPRHSHGPTAQEALWAFTEALEQVSITTDL